MPRSVAAAGIVLAGIGLIGLLGYVLYGRAMSFAEELPVYASKILQRIIEATKEYQAAHPRKPRRRRWHHPAGHTINN
jgi:predicted PurR-regulated permease PerM